MYHLPGPGGVHYRAMQNQDAARHPVAMNVQQQMFWMVQQQLQGIPPNQNYNVPQIPLNPRLRNPTFSVLRGTHEPHRLQNFRPGVPSPSYRSMDTSQVYVHPVSAVSRHQHANPATTESRLVDVSRVYVHPSQGQPQHQQNLLHQQLRPIQHISLQRQQQLQNGQVYQRLNLQQHAVLRQPPPQHHIQIPQPQQQQQQHLQNPYGPKKKKKCLDDILAVLYARKGHKMPAETSIDALFEKATEGMSGRVLLRIRQPTTPDMLQEMPLSTTSPNAKVRQWLDDQTGITPDRPITPESLSTATSICDLCNMVLKSRKLLDLHKKNYH